MIGLITRHTTPNGGERHPVVLSSTYHYVRDSLLGDFSLASAVAMPTGSKGSRSRLLLTPGREEGWVAHVCAAKLVVPSQKRRRHGGIYSSETDTPALHESTSRLISPSAHPLTA